MGSHAVFKLRDGSLNTYYRFMQTCQCVQCVFLFSNTWECANAPSLSSSEMCGDLRIILVFSLFACIGICYIVRWKPHCYINNGMAAMTMDKEVRKNLILPEDSV